MGLLKESYGSEYRSDETFSSFWNPRRLKNNCILVSVGYLLGIDAESLSDMLRVTLPQHIKGMGVGEMELILGGLPGCHLVIFPFDKTIKYSPQTQQRKAMRILSKWIARYKKHPFAIGYQRTDRSGHCVIAKPSRRTKEDTMKNYTFWCYQTRTKGVNVTEDVRASFIRFAIFIDPRKRAMEMDFFYGTTLPGDVSHVRVVEDDLHSDASSITTAYAPLAYSYSHEHASYTEPHPGHQSSNGLVYHPTVYSVSGEVPQPNDEEEMPSSSRSY
jgi:hypothetical protein